MPSTSPLHLLDLIYRRGLQNKSRRCRRKVNSQRGEAHTGTQVAERDERQHLNTAFEPETNFIRILVIEKTLFSH